MTRILVNLASLNDEIMPTWLRLFKKFQSFGCEIYVNAGVFVKKLDHIKDVYNFQWLEEREKEIILKDKTSTKIGFLAHSLKRNVSVMLNSQAIFKENKFDLIYTPSSVLDFVIYPYFLKIIGKKIKWTTTFANVVPATDPGNKLIRLLVWFFFHISLKMIRKADMIFAATPELKDYLLGRKFRRDKITVTAFAVESELIEQARADDAYKIDALFTGRINETKGIYDLLRVLALVKKRYPCFQLAIMGEGDDVTKNKFKASIKKMNLENSVQLLGFKLGMEKYNIIKSAKSFWFLSVSESESFGVALLEAVCSGIPAFAYDLPQFARLYPDGEVNISPKGDYKAVAEKVIKLFESGNFQNVKGEKLLGKYSWEKIAEIEYGRIKYLLTNN